MNKRELGEFYENKAADYLTEHGCVILKRNYTTKIGEIDLICKDGDTIVFVEVKYRRTADFGEGMEAVDIRKIRKMYRTAEIYVAKTQEQDCHYRFDCVSFLDHETKWLKNVIWGDEFGF
ncbi:MAG: YraN family protein [Fusobacteriaceae bacterium]|jgi:putative endonuclease|nr:YraN family protein [Fusobacteriaceae bacterium]